MKKLQILGLILSTFLLINTNQKSLSKDIESKQIPVSKNQDTNKTTYAENTTKNLGVGLKAPDFTSKDSSNNEIQLSKYIGKKNILLVFYPGDNTPGCTKQLCDIRDDFKDLEKLDVKVFGINQADSESHKSFIKNNNFQFELIVDKDKQIANKYNAVNFFGLISRTVVLINKKGDIVLYERGFPDVSPKVIEKLI